MNKKLIISTSALILIFIIKLNMSHYDDYQTSLLPGVFIQEKNADLISNRWSVPLAIDWNNDGNKDLLIGNRTYARQSSSKGYISFYENRGTDSSPVFEGFNYVKACADTCSDLTVVPDG